MAIVPNRYLQPTGGPFAQMGPGGSRLGQGFLPHPGGGGGMPGGMFGAHPQGPVSIFGNRHMFGAGGKESLHDLLGGISQDQLHRMQQGLTPGGFGGDFVGINPARLKFLANLMVANQMSGQEQDPTYSLQHRYGDGLFAGRKMPLRPGLGQPSPPMRPVGGGPMRPRGGNPMQMALMQAAMRRLGG